jgi:hypothetical protein
VREEKGEKGGDATYDDGARVSDDLPAAQRPFDVQRRGLRRRRGGLAPACLGRGEASCPYIRTGFAAPAVAVAVAVAEAEVEPRRAQL